MIANNRDALLGTSRAPEEQEDYNKCRDGRKTVTARRLPSGIQMFTQQEGVLRLLSRIPSCRKVAQVNRWLAVVRPGRWYQGLGPGMGGPHVAKRSPRRNPKEPLDYGTMATAVGTVTTRSLEFRTVLTGRGGGAGGYVTQQKTDTVQAELVLASVTRSGPRARSFL